WSSNFYTETLIERVRHHFQNDFWGFWMLGGMSGGGMGFIVAPHRKAEAQDYLQETMSATKRALQHSLPFAMEPVVYDFAINPYGTVADLLQEGEALLPAGYYAMQAPQLLRQDPRQLTPLRREELDRFGAACRVRPEMAGMVETLFDQLFPRTRKEEAGPQTPGAPPPANACEPGQHKTDPDHPKTGLNRLAQKPLHPRGRIADNHTW